MSKQIDNNGFWLIEGNPVSKEGVFPYLGKSISPQLEPGRIYYVYRPFAELASAETLKSFDGVPLIEDHEMLGDGFTSTDKRAPKGVLMNTRADGGMMYGDIKIFSDAIKASIEGGKKELSLGYKCNYRLEPGEWNGQRYDAVQTDLRGNHLALVDKGRMGSSVRVYDWAMDALEIEKAITNNNHKESETMPDEKEKKSPETEAKDEKVDKRKLIDGVAGFLKEKGLSDEDIRFCIGKMEKMSYNDSESGKATDACDPAEKKEEKAEDKCGKDGCGKDAEGEEKKPEEKKAEDKCGKDEMYDGPKLERTVNKMIEGGEISESAGKKILSSMKYERAADAEEGEEKKPEEEKKSGMDEAEVVKMIDRRNALYKRLTDHVGEFAVDGMTEAEVAAYACDKLGLKAADGGEAIALVSGYLAGAQKSAKTYSMDSAPAARRGEVSKKITDYLNGK